jgi:hypothetical protein
MGWNMSVVTAVASSWSIASARSYAQIAELGKLARLVTVSLGKVTSLLTSSHQSTSSVNEYSPAYAPARTQIVSTLVIGSTNLRRNK